MLRKIAMLLAAATLLVSISACNILSERSPGGASSEEEQDPNYPVVIGDIRIGERPEKIISLSPALTEVICELGAQGRLEGVSNFCDFPDSVTKLKSCGTSALPDLDMIGQLAPQVVFSSAALSQDDTVKLQQMGAEVVIAPPAETLDELKILYETVGMVLDGMETGKQNADDVFAPYQAKYDALVRASETISTPLSAVYLCSEPLTMATGDTFVGTLMQSVGIQNSAEDFSGWEYPEDKAVDLYPDAIFYGEPVDEAFLKESKVYNTTDAVKNDMIFPVDSTAFDRQSGRMFDELYNMFTALYPDVPVDLNASAPPNTEESASEESAQTSQEPDISDDEMINLDDMTSIVE